MKVRGRLVRLIALFTTLCLLCVTAAAAAGALMPIGTDGWSRYGNDWYWFKDGAIATGWLQTDGDWYYLDPADGHMLTGQQTIDGVRYYLYDNGVMATGWVNLDGAWHWFDSSGAMATGFADIEGERYYIDPASGTMLTGMQTVNGAEYYFYGDGAMATGWVELDGKWYWFNQDGAMATGLITVDGNRYYLDTADGHMLADEWVVDYNTREQYYLMSDGRVATNRNDLPAGGHMLTGLQTINGATCYLDANGEIVSGWVQLDDEWHWFDDSGAMVSDSWIQVDGNWFRLDEDGALLTGWQLIDNMWYYLNPVSGVNGLPEGARATGWLKLGDARYWFDNSGVMATGWKDLNGSRYWFDDSGVMATGWLQDGANWYYMDPADGHMLTDQWVTDYDAGTRSYLTADGHMAREDELPATESRSAAPEIDFARIRPIAMAVVMCLLLVAIVIVAFQLVKAITAYINEKAPAGGGRKPRRGRKNPLLSYEAATVTGWVDTSGNQYNPDPVDGHKLVGLQTINGVTCYLNPDGKMAKGWLQINGSQYWFDENGAMATGWIETDGRRYYLDPADGHMLTGLQTIDGAKYYLFDDGSMATGWVNLNDYWYWFGTNGVMATGWVETGGGRYYLDPTDGHMLTNQLVVDNDAGKQYYLMRNGRAADDTGSEYPLNDSLIATSESSNLPEQGKLSDEGLKQVEAELDAWAVEYYARLRSDVPQLVINPAVEDVVHGFGRCNISNASGKSHDDFIEDAKHAFYAVLEKHPNYAKDGFGYLSEGKTTITHENNTYVVTFSYLYNFAS